MKRMLLLILPLIVMSAPMSARGDDTMSTQPAPAQTDQIPSADVAKDRVQQEVQVAIELISRPTQVAIDLTYDPAKVAITKLIAPAQVAMRLVGKSMDVALMIVKSQRHALQIMKPQAQLALTKIHRLASVEPSDIICLI